MYHSHHSLFDSAWPEAVGIVLGALLLLHIFVRRSPWAVVPWLSIAVATSLGTFGLAAILLLLSTAGHGTGDMFHPLAFAGPVVVALVIGLPTCFVVWWLRPTFNLLQRKHWVAAILALPIFLILLLNAPRMYNTEVVIQCESRTDALPASVSMQQMENNEVIPIGTPVAADSAGRFHITLNRRESFTEIISAPGYQPIRIAFFPIAKKGFWLFFRGSEQLQLPLHSLGTQVVAMEKAPHQALERAAPRVTPAAPPPSPTQPSHSHTQLLSLWALGVS